jgi:hypothetical protein
MPGSDRPQPATLIQTLPEPGASMRTRCAKRELKTHSDHEYVTRKFTFSRCAC